MTEEGKLARLAISCFFGIFFVIIVALIVKSHYENEKKFELAKECFRLTEKAIENKQMTPSCYLR